METNITYCVFCKKGLEFKVADYFNLNNGIKAIAPTKVLSEKRHGKWVDKEVSLFPNYIFVYATDEIDITRLSRSSDAYRLLQYDVGHRKLIDKDLAYAMWIYENKGKIQASKYIQEGKTIKVIEGPLVNNIGTIQKIDKHKRRIWVGFDFDGTMREVILSAECVTVI